MAFEKAQADRTLTGVEQFLMMFSRFMGSSMMMISVNPTLIVGRWSKADVRGTLGLETVNDMVESVSKTTDALYISIECDEARCWSGTCENARRGDIVPPIAPAIMVVMTTIIPGTYGTRKIDTALLYIVQVTTDVVTVLTVLVTIIPPTESTGVKCSQWRLSYGVVNKAILYPVGYVRGE
ncbi:hypothetical protein KM043_016770 [Ampulex compressa]|nr:hypothetical protein KM043_016770 [Ampulex compressa]